MGGGHLPYMGGTSLLWAPQMGTFLVWKVGIFLDQRHQAAKQRRISSTTGEACAFDGRIAKKSLRVSSRPAAPSEAGAMLSAHN